MAKVFFPIKVGQTVKINSEQYASYGVAKGSKHKVTAIGANANNFNIFVESYGSVNIARTYAVQVFLNKAELELEIKEIEEEVKTIKQKLKWMRDTKSDEYDEEQFWIWSILETLDKDADNVTKSKKIAEILAK